MPPTIANPSFETDSDWTKVRNALYDSGNAYDGSSCMAFYTGQTGFPGPPTTFYGSAYQTVTGFVPSRIYRLSLWAKQYEDPPVPLPLHVRATWPDGTWQIIVEAFPFESSSWVERSARFVALDESCELRIVVEATGYNPPQALLVDDLTLYQEGGPVAVLLAERAIAQTLLALQDANGLSGELTKIATERGDAVTCRVPDRWYTAPRAELSSDAVSVEVFSDVTRFVDQEKRLPSWSVGVREALPSECDVTIRLTHANRDGSSLGVMRKRTERYAAALVRVLRNYPTLMDSSGFVRWAKMIETRSTTEDAIVDNEGRIVVDRLTFSVTVNMNEGSAGEGQENQGVPPSHTVSEN